ncbi:MAG: hypothetical protein AAFP84_14135, partial [Actinomycetota bacterium]
VVGCLMLLPGLGIVAGGSTLAIAQIAATDDDGYYSFTLERVESAGVAVATTDVWFDAAEGDAPWLFDLLDVDIRLRVDGAGASDEAFVGVARAVDVERYLAGSSWSEVTELDDRSPRYREVDGSNIIGAPAEQAFWVESAVGTGTQELTWDARGGRWSVVVMNADGSPSVDADVEIGARSGVVVPTAITLLVVGGLIVTTSIVLIVLGARGRRSNDGPGAEQQVWDDQPAADGGAVDLTSFPPPAVPVDDGDREQALVR